MFQRLHEPVHPNKPEVLQLHRGGVLLVWRPVQSSDPVSYCVQYCTDGEFTDKMFTVMSKNKRPGFCYVKHFITFLCIFHYVINLLVICALMGGFGF